MTIIIFLVFFDNKLVKVYGSTTEFHTTKEGVCELKGVACIYKDLRNEVQKGIIYKLFSSLYEFLISYV